MINVKRKKCEKDGCKSTTYEGENRGKFCKKHKEENMVNVNVKKCLKDDCKLIPSFNYEGQPLYCSIHKDINMIDVIHSQKEGCNSCMKDRL